MSTVKSITFATPQAPATIETPLVVEGKPKAARKAAAKAKSVASNEATKAKLAAKAKAPKPTPKQAKPERKHSLDDAHAEVQRLIAAESGRRTCLCGCGANTPRAFFSPGHDARLVSRFLNAQ